MMDRRESHQTTNTSHLATLSLTNSEVRLRDRHDRTECVKGLVTDDPNSPALLLFPSEDAQVLTPELAGAHGATLIVPDATWRTASRMVRKVSLLSTLPRVVLPPGPPALCWLRKPPREGALSSLEAIARALGILEGPEIQADLERLLLLMVKRHKIARGLVKA